MHTHAHTHTHFYIFSLSLVGIHLNSKMDGLNDVLIFKTKIKQARLHYCLFICSVDKLVFFCLSECFVHCIGLITGAFMVLVSCRKTKILNILIIKIKFVFHP